MKIIGMTAVQLDEFSFSDLRGIEARCAETNLPLTPGEKVIIFAEGIVSENGTIVAVDPAIRFIKIQVPGSDGSPLEDFVSRYLNNVPQPVVPALVSTENGTAGPIVQNTTTVPVE